MKILFFNSNRFIEDELREFVSDMDGEIFFADTPEKAVTILNTCSVDIFFLEVIGIAEISLLKYANEYFKNIRIMLITDQYIENAINTFRKGEFELMREPFELGKLRDVLMENINIIKEVL